MEWLLTASEERVRTRVDATQAVVSKPVLCLEMPPLTKFTVPGGGATRVLPSFPTRRSSDLITDWPNLLGLTEEASVVVVSALLTTWVSAVEVEGLKLLSSA